MKDRELAESRAEIERLNSEAELFGYEYDRAYAALVRMREALEPFAREAQLYDDMTDPGDNEWRPHRLPSKFTVRDLRRAREALDHAPSSEKGGDAPEQPSPVVALPASADTLERAAVRDAAMARYRYAIDWVAADSWDHCSECRARLEWARSSDERSKLSSDELAEIGKTYLAAEPALKSQSSPPSSDVAGELLAALEVFALLTPPDSMNDPDDMPLSDTPSSVALTVGDLRRARSAIAKARALESSPVPPSTPEPEHD